MRAAAVVVNIAMTALLLFALVPAFQGGALHELGGLAVVLLLAAHAALHLDALRVAKVGRGAAQRAARLNVAVDVALVVALMAVAVSGLLVSGAVLPALGFYAEGYFFWDPLHALTAKVLVALVIVHVALHAQRLSWAFGGGGRRAVRHSFKGDPAKR